jgi:hypothetical protein
MKYLISFLIYLVGETEDEDLNREYVEETTRDVVIIAAGKLITSNVVPLVKTSRI